MLLWLLKLRRTWAAQTGNCTRIISCSSRSAAGAYDGGVDEPEVATQATALLKIFQQMREDFCKCPVATPTPEASVNSLPRAVVFWDVSPGSAGVKAPQDSIEEAVVIFQGPATAAVVYPVWEEGRDALPLRPRKLVPTAHRQLPRGYLPSSQLGSAVM